MFWLIKCFVFGYLFVVFGCFRNCNLPRSSLFIRCNTTDQLPTHSNEDLIVENGFYAQLNLTNFELEDIAVEETEGGIYIRPGQKLKVSMKYFSHYFSF